MTEEREMLEAELGELYPADAFTRIWSSANNFKPLVDAVKIMDSGYSSIPKRYERLAGLVESEALVPTEHLTRHINSWIRSRDRYLYDLVREISSFHSRLVDISREGEALSAVEHTFDLPWPKDGMLPWLHDYDKNLLIPRIYFDYLSKMVHSFGDVPSLQIVKDAREQVVNFGYSAANVRRQGNSRIRGSQPAKDPKGNRYEEPYVPGGVKLSCHDPAFGGESSSYRKESAQLRKPRKCLFPQYLLLRSD